MHLKTNILTFIFISFCLLSCKNITENKLAQNSDCYLELYYLSPGTTSPMLIPCGYISNAAYKNRRYYQKITDEKTLNEFFKLYDKLENLSENDTLYDVDSRIEIRIHRANQRDLVCLGEYSRVSVNSVLKIDSPEFRDFIKNILTFKEEM